MYEHGGNPPNGLGQRHSTGSSGLSDIRLGIGYWITNPENTSKTSIAAALGLKLPSGKYDYKDTFYNQGPNRDQTKESVVDQSIQPGDGGLGVTLDLQGNYMLSHHLNISTNLYYLSNPRESNGVLTRNGSQEFSCPDQYAARLGLTFSDMKTGLAAYFGGRLEGVPSADLLGSSAGYRRPGFVVSLEPGISLPMERLSLSLNVPFAIHKNRTQSYDDKRITAETGIYRHGDAAFANYLININVGYYISRSKTDEPAKYLKI